MSNPLAMGKTIEQIQDINRVAVRSALVALYDTHLEDQESATLRGLALQAVAKLAEHLGFDGLIPEIEAIPASQRRRESWLWKIEDPK